MNLILPRKNVKWRWWNALEGKDALKNQSIIVTGGERPLQTFQSVLCELAGGILYFDWGYLLWEVAQALAVLHVAHSACCVKYELMYHCLETEQSIKLVSTDKWVESHGRCGIFSYHPNFPWFHSSLNFWESPRLFPIPSHLIVYPPVWVSNFDFFSVTLQQYYKDVQVKNMAYTFKTLAVALVIAVRVNSNSNS